LCSLAPATLSKLVGAFFGQECCFLVASKRHRLASLAFARRVGPDLFAYAPSALEAGAAVVAPDPK
jgi:hypothetical protein